MTATLEAGTEHGQQAHSHIFIHRVHAIAAEAAPTSSFTRFCIARSNRRHHQKQLFLESAAMDGRFWNPSEPGASRHPDPYRQAAITNDRTCFLESAAIDG
ncbi:MAG TPA: hypothetical protein VFS55_01535, partial [Dokdonella sp.]|nr:hypothetical protein [Dokdonella sp.]